MHQLIEECCTEVSEEQKQNMEDTMLELVKICQEKEFLYIHDNVDDLIESALNSKLLLINSNSQRLEKEQQEVKNVVEQPAEHGNRIESLQNFRVIHKSFISLNTSQISLIHAIAPILSTKGTEQLFSMGYENSNTTLETESDEIIKFGVEELVPILSENEVTLEDKKECDVPIFEYSPICDNHSDIFFDFKNDVDISVYDDDFKDIEYVEASLSNPEIINVEEENVVQQEEEVERLIYVVKNDISDDSSNDPLLEEADLFLVFDNSIPPGIEKVADDSEEDIRFLKELLIDDSIPSHESSDSNFEDNLSIPRPHPKPPDAETDAGEEILVVMNNKDEDVDYSSFIFVIFAKVFSFLFAESEDTIFDPGISV
nr:hypothetical protein [Tanacetum cinerariifolium]